MIEAFLVVIVWLYSTKMNNPAVYIANDID